MAGARCSVVWDWGDYGTLFEPDPALEVIGRLPDGIVRGYRSMRTLMNEEGGSPESRRIPLDGPTRILLESCHCFTALSDPEPMDEKALLAWLPRPSRAVSDQAAAFRAASFPAGPIVGPHLRRTDNKGAIMIAPDRLFVRAARSARRKSVAVFLAADNAETEARLRARIGGGVIAYPKDPGVGPRWPKQFEPAQIAADYIDLLLLAGCDHVLGSWGSSYSSLAIALNGSPRSRRLTTRWWLPSRFW